MRWSFFFGPTNEIHVLDTYIYAVIETRPNGGSERPHKSGKRSHSYVKKLFKTQHGRIPIDPAILAVIGHRFIATTKTKRKLKLLVETRNWRLCFGGGGRSWNWKSFPLGKLSFHSPKDSLVSSLHWRFCYKLDDCINCILICDTEYNLVEIHHSSRNNSTTGDRRHSPTKNFGFALFIFKRNKNTKEEVG